MAFQMHNQNKEMCLQFILGIIWWAILLCEKKNHYQINKNHIVNLSKF